MPNIETPRLILRPYIWNDLDWLFDLYSDPLVMRFIGEGRPRNREETIESLSKMMQHWIRFGFGIYVVQLKELHQLIGHCGVSCFRDHEQAELSLTFARSFWGRGYATESARAVLEDAWGSLFLNHVIAHARPGNRASIRVLEKVGMILVGIEECENEPAVIYRMEKPKDES